MTPATWSWMTRLSRVAGGNHRVVTWGAGPAHAGVAARARGGDTPSHKAVQVLYHYLIWLQGASRACQSVWWVHRVEYRGEWGVWSSADARCGACGLRCARSAAWCADETVTETLRGF